MIKNLSIKNFGCIEQADINLGMINTFSGKNGIGKTTILNALYWLLTDKKLSDVFASENDTKGIIPNENDKAVVSVSITLDNGTTFKKEYYNNYVKERGTNNIVFKGRVTEYYLNDAKCNQSDYYSFIQSVFNFNMRELEVSDKSFNYMSMLIDPFYLFSKVDYKTQRQIVGSIVGNITNEMIINSNPKYEDLIEVNTKYLGDMDKARTDFNSAIRKLKKDQEVAEGQINVLGNVNFNIDEYNLLTKQNEDLIVSMADVSSELSNTIRDKQNELFTLNNELIKSKTNDKTIGKNQKLIDLLNDRTRLNEEISKINIDYSNKRTLANSYLGNIELNKNSIKSNEDSIAKNEERLADLLEWKPTTYECPNCGYVLTTDEEITRQEEEHNREVNAIKTSITESQNKIDKYNNEINDYNSKIDGILKELQDLKAKQEELNNQLNELNNSISLEQTDTKEYISQETTDLQSKVEALNSEINQLKQTEQEEINNKKNDILAKINDLKPRLDDVIAKKNNNDKLLEIRNNLNAIITELNNKENLSTLCDSFIKDKIKMTNNAVSKKLGINFVMLETQVNGGFKEVCYPTTDDGVPYNDSNTAFKILCGVKIRQCTALGCTLPIIIDRGESLDNNSKALIKNYGIQTFVANVTNDEKIIVNTEE